MKLNRYILVWILSPQWTSVDVLENMANKFQNLSGKTSDKDPNGMKKAGNNLLLGIGNVLDASVAKPESPELGQNEQEETVEEVNVTKVWRFFLSFRAFLALVNRYDTGPREFEFNRSWSVLTAIAEKSIL